MEHDLTVSYSAGVQSPKEFPSGWTFEWDDDGEVAGYGPCPWCYGSAYGPPLRIAERQKPKPAGRDFIAVCACGGPHGKDNATSCGRKFLVQAPESDRG